MSVHTYPRPNHTPLPAPNALRDLFYAARGLTPGNSSKLSRPEIVRRALEMEGCPDNLDVCHIYQLENGTRPPVGSHLRYFAAAAGIHLIDAFRAIDYWPPVGWDEDRHTGFRELCAVLGFAITNQIGDRFVVEVPK